MFKKSVLTLFAALSLFGCVTNPETNGVAQFYQPLVGAAAGTSKNVEPQYTFASSIAQELQMVATYRRNGYHVIGASGFTDLVNTPYQSQAIAQAKRIKADLIIYVIQPYNREVINKPVLTSFSTGQYITTDTNAQWRDNSFNTIYGSGTSSTYVPGGMTFQMIPTTVTRMAHVITFLAR